MKISLFMLLLAACGDGAAVGPDASPDGPPGVERPVVGGIEILESRFTFGGAGSRVAARFYNGHPPRWHRETMRAGGCVLRLHTPSSCTPACTSGLCVDGVCEAFPGIASGGRLTVTGLTTGVQIDPMDGFYYDPGALPEELFTDSATVTARLAGAAVPAMTLSARGVPKLVAAIQPDKLVLPYPASQDFVVRWTPASGDSRVRLTLNANNQGHGLPYLGIIECDAPDSAGQIAIPAAMLDAFPATEAAQICAGTDCPPSVIRRYQRATHAFGENDIELVVGSELQFLVEHDRP
ncbi:MAG: hypothetical protein H0T46_00535 [Deltaproteobacteria bacterium]|nr:hypothetical protein [Deltaproteobacteria bacterium]